MQLRYRELEPDVARHMWTAQQAARQVAPRATLEPVWSFLSLLSAVAIIGLYVLLCFNTGGALLAIVFLLTPCLVLATVLFSVRGRDGRPKLPLAGFVTPEALQALLTEPELSRTRRLYAELLLLLLESPSLRRRSHRELLREVNALAASDLRMAAYQTQVAARVDPNTLLQTEAERGALTERLARADDLVVREALAESLTLCVSRLEEQRALPQTLARLDAHRELIFQALSLTHATLLRAQAAPFTATPPDLSALKARVAQLTSEARAIEELASRR